MKTSKFTEEQILFALKQGDAGRLVRRAGRAPIAARETERRVHVRSGRE